MIRQLPIKVGLRDPPLALRDFSRSNKQKLSANVTISLHSHPHLHQSILTILSCGVQSISSSLLFSSYKRFLRNSLRGSITNDFSVFICLMISSLLSDKLLASKKDFLQFFLYQCLLTLSVV